jgi:NhaP-type Na+/H+ or K+/H+ antiporter
MSDDDSKAFSFVDALLYGAIVSATDPVAVVALLKELGASK